MLVDVAPPSAYSRPAPVAQRLDRPKHKDIDALRKTAWLVSCRHCFPVLTRLHVAAVSPALHMSRDSQTISCLLEPSLHRDHRSLVRADMLSLHPDAYESLTMPERMPLLVLLLDLESDHLGVRM